MSSDTFIVKVQLALLDNSGNPVLIYNKDRTVEFHGELKSELAKKMKGEPKAFFYAKLVDKQIELGRKAHWQEW